MVNSFFYIGILGIVSNMSSAIHITRLIHIARQLLFWILGFMLTVHYSLFDFPMRGVWWRCVAVLLPYLLAVILLAQAVGALFRCRESSIVWLLWLSIPFLLVSGGSLPPEAFPKWLYIVGKAVPSSSAVDAWIAVQSRGATLADVAPELTLLWCLVVFYGVGAVVANRRSITH